VLLRAIASGWVLDFADHCWVAAYSAWLPAALLPLHLQTYLAQLHFALHLGQSATAAAAAKAAAAATATSNTPQEAYLL